jgi:hypothetical protein
MPLVTAIFRYHAHDGCGFRQTNSYCDDGTARGCDYNAEKKLQALSLRAQVLRWSL